MQSRNSKINTNMRARIKVEISSIFRGKDPSHNLSYITSKVWVKWVMRKEFSSRTKSTFNVRAQWVSKTTSDWTVQIVIKKWTPNHWEKYLEIKMVSPSHYPIPIKTEGILRFKVRLLRTRVLSLLKRNMEIAQPSLPLLHQLSLLKFKRSSQPRVKPSAKPTWCQTCKLSMDLKSPC